MSASEERSGGASSVRLINPPGLAPPRGFSHVAVAGPGRLVCLAGQTGHDAAGRIAAPGDLVAQFERALASIVVALGAAGAGVGDVVRLTLYVTDVPAYRAALRSLGEAYRRHFGRHYPAMTLVGVSGLYDEEALVEIDCWALVPEPAAASEG
jgi:enamine deaminase RidA (YjgF/YER057c/UK114 family)